MNINYDTLTLEELEEHVESIDWFHVPSHLITEEIKKKFISIKQLNAIIWLNDLFSKMVIKEDQKEFPDELFFFIGDKWYMNLELKTGNLWCSKNNFWFVFGGKFHYNYTETSKFLKNIMELHLENILVAPAAELSIHNQTIEKHFEDLKITSLNSVSSTSEKIVTRHFQKKELILIRPKANYKTDVTELEHFFKDKEIKPILGLPDKNIDLARELQALSH